MNSRYSKQRLKSIQGLRSFKDTLPTNIKKVINKRGHIFSEILNNWKFLVGDILFKVCFPKSFKNSNRFGVSTLHIMVKRGHEIDLEYSKKKIVDKMNGFFGYNVVEKLKFISFSDDENLVPNNDFSRKNMTNNKFQKKIESVKNEKIKNSLNELIKVFKKK